MRTPVLLYPTPLAGEHGAAGAALARGVEAELADLRRRRLLRGDVGVLLLGDVVEKGV